MPIISVIVPVYNAEKYLHRCIDSILMQTFADFELLLINDGSTDLSSAICDEYALSDSRIKTIHKPNTGVSSTRNRGLEESQGKYIIFLDADDFWYVNTALEQLVEIAEKYGLDVVRGEYKAVDQDGNDLFERPLTKEKQQIANQILTSGQFYTQIMCGENFLVLSLFKRESIGNIRLNDKRSFLEDMEFYAELLLQPLRCVFIPMRFYAYRKVDSSASHIPKVKNLQDSFSMCDVFNKYANVVEDEIIREAYRTNSIMMYYWTLDTMSQAPYYKDRLSLIKKLSLVKLNRQVRDWVITTKKIYPLPIYISPLLGIYYFRFRHKIGDLLRKLKRKSN